MKRLMLVLTLALGALSASAAPPDTVRLIFAGDLMLDDGPGRVIADGRDPLQHFAPFLKEADYTLGNLECPVATVGQPMESKIFSFRAHPRVMAVLKGRFDAVSVANNHSGDYGQEAFRETLGHLRTNGIAVVGGGENLAQAHAPLWIEQKGLRIAVLAYNEFKPRSFEAGPDWPGVAWSEDTQVVADIRAARAAGADLVIPYMHWGWEREPTTSERQRRLARILIDAGADVVVGGHPHITQGAEIYRGKPIIYSLGNFVFDSFEAEVLRTGWLLRMSVDKSGVVAWETRAARADDEGTPHPLPGVKTPCGRRESATVEWCVNP